MNALPLVERAEAYLSIHLTHSGPSGPHPSEGPFVTISRESGTGGSALVQLLAEQLPRRIGHPWVVYSGNLIEEMLRTNDLPPHLARFLPEDRISELDASIGEIVGLHPNLWDLVGKTNELIRCIARTGHAILLGRGAVFATADIPNGIHVRLVAPAKHRAARTARWLSIDFASAADHNTARDAARQRYVRSTFDRSITDPAAYDLVVNVARVPLESIVDLIGSFVAAHEPAHLAH
ncbi:MAG: cytidylate kinase family protein [Opitutus sp.]